jgi:hypothetical protein
MINHVVLFKLKEFETLEEKSAMLLDIKSKLLALQDFIEELKYIEVGLNHTLESSSFDVCLISHFESFEDLDRYQVHPEHVKVGGFIKSVAVSRAAVDYKIC